MALKWAAAQCAGQGQADPTPAQLRAALGPALFDIRFPRRLLIVPIVLIGFLVSIIVRVVDRSLFEDKASTDAVPGVALTIALVGVLPLLAVLGYARSAVRSDGRVLRVRSGFVTRTIPAADIDGFVLVDRSGARCRSRFGARPAIAIRPGSPSARGGLPADTDAGALVRALSNRRGDDLPLACVPASIVSRKRLDDALRQLSAWHRWTRA